MKVFGNRWVNLSTGYQLSLLTPTASNHINSLNNQLQMGSSHYDPAGNLDIDATGSTFTYDGENRQVTATYNQRPTGYIQLRWRRTPRNEDSRKRQFGRDNGVCL